MLCLSREGFAEAAGTNAKHTLVTTKKKKDKAVLINFFRNGIHYPASRRTYLLNKTGQVLSKTTFLDSRFRGSDSHLPPIVIPAKAGIQGPHRNLLRCYRRTYYLRAINGGKAFLELIDILQDPLVYCKQHGEQSAAPVPCRFQHVFYAFFRGFCGKDRGTLF